MPPCLLFEDEHLLAVNKPAGLNTHAPSPYAGEGLYDWLRHREPRWAGLAIIHRLDKETSGVIVFAKTPFASRSLTDQFTRRVVRKRYLLLTDRPAPKTELRVKSSLARIGDKYASRRTGGELAETVFAPAAALSPVVCPPRAVVEATPLTGRTHQIRVHAAERGFPILGDTLYGGTPAARVFLHAAEITFRHPESGREVTFTAEAAFDRDPRRELRRLLIEPTETDSFRLVHGASDGLPGLFVDRLGDFLLAQSERPPDAAQQETLERLVQSESLAGAYHKVLSRNVRKAAPEDAAPKLLTSSAAPAAFEVRENGVRFELSFSEGYSVGLFLDQRDNRRRLLTGHVGKDFTLAGRGDSAASEVLNVFAYTCGFSVCAAKRGARTTSLDLSKKYLEWGRRNFTLNQLDPAAHDFVYGDAFDWLARFAKKRRAFDLVLLDPPTFSQSKASGAFRVEKDFGRLAAAALRVLKPGGVLFASSNAASWAPEDFVRSVESAIHSSGRTIQQRLYVPQPADFPVSRAEPAYLKTMWLRIG